MDVDNANQTGYNNIVNSDNVSSIDGDNINGKENSGAGVTGLCQGWSKINTSDGGGNEIGRPDSGRNPGFSAEFRITESINREKLNTAGVTDNEFRETTSNPELFSFALEAGKRSNPNGVMVDSHTAEELRKSGAKTFLSKDNMAGGAVMPDGNSTAVFKNKGAHLNVLV